MLLKRHFDLYSIKGLCTGQVLMRGISRANFFKLERGSVFSFWLEAEHQLTRIHYVFYLFGEELS